MNRRIVIIVGILIVAASLWVRLFRYREHMVFTGDTTSELLFAWDDLHAGKLSLLGPAATGTIGQNLPYIEQFYQGLLIVTGNNPYWVLVWYAGLMGLVPLLFYLWGIAEDDPLGGAVAAAFALIQTNSSQILRLSFLVAVAGLVLVRFGQTKRRDGLAVAGYAVLAFSAAIHASNIATVIVMFVMDVLSRRNVRLLVREVQAMLAVGIVSAVPFALATLWYGDRFVLFNSGHPVCLTCINRLPEYASGIVRWFAAASVPSGFAAWAFPAVGTGLAILALATRTRAMWRALGFTALYIVFLYFTIDRLEERYFLPCVPFLFVGAGSVISVAARSGRRPLAALAVAVTVFALGIGLASYIKDRQWHWSQYDSVTNVVGSIRTMADARGIAHDDYVLVGAFSWEDILSATSALWLTEEWHYGKAATTRRPVPDYVPTERNFRPEWYFLVCAGFERDSDCRAKMQRLYGAYQYQFAFDPGVPRVTVYGYRRPPWLTAGGR